VNGVTTQFLYDGVDIAQQFESQRTTSYLRSLAVDETLGLTRPDASFYLIADGLGSALATTDAAGNAVTEYTYDPFGVVSTTDTASENPFQYTGRESDSPTGLYYYRARYYVPALARFASEDPLGQAMGRLLRLNQRESGASSCMPSLGSAEESNLYAYVANNPLASVDPFGLKKSAFDCYKVYGTCVTDCAVLPGFTTFITTGGDLGSAYYATKTFVYAAARNLTYPAKSPVYRAITWRAATLAPLAQLTALNYCIWTCLGPEAKCAGLIE
jgi:RHS repeat-associated protein